MRPRVKICKKLGCKWLDTYTSDKGKPHHCCTRSRRLGPVDFDLLYSCPSGFKEQHTHTHTMTITRSFRGSTDN